MTGKGQTDPNGGAPQQPWAHVIQPLVEQWSLSLGPKLDGGTVAHVFAATDAEGRDCVLKFLPELSEGQGDYAAERDVLLAAAGRGYVEVFAHDDVRQAFLLERLGRKMADNGQSVDEWIDALCGLLLETWSVAIAPQPSLMTAADKCEWFSDFIPRTWRDLNEPCPRAVIDEALVFVARRGEAFDPSTAMVVHGDAHAWNALELPTGGYKFIDPDPFVAEPAADLSVPMREWNAELLQGAHPRRATQHRCARIATITNCDPQAVWEWGFIERVSTGLLNLRDAPHKELSSYEFLAVAEACVGFGA